MEVGTDSESVAPVPTATVPPPENNSISPDFSLLPERITAGPLVIASGVFSTERLIDPDSRPTPEMREIEPPVDDRELPAPILTSPPRPSETLELFIIKSPADPDEGPIRSLRSPLSLVAADVATVQAPVTSGALFERNEIDPLADPSLRFFPEASATFPVEEENATTSPPAPDAFKTRNCMPSAFSARAVPVLRSNLPEKSPEDVPVERPTVPESPRVSRPLCTVTEPLGLASDPPLLSVILPPEFSEDTPARMWTEPP
jgi:hypothetical protein